jgi:hypothetical protein
MNELENLHMFNDDSIKEINSLIGEGKDMNTLFLILFDYGFKCGIKRAIELLNKKEIVYKLKQISIY